MSDPSSPPAAQPAEPMTAQQFFHDKYDRFFMPMIPSGVFRFAQAYAEYRTAVLQAKYDKAMRALESLTPSGSEFVNDVERCVAHIRKRQEAQHQTILSFSKRAKDAEQRAKAAERRRAERNGKEKV